ncbi:GNAT family N-acetyltransferase [Streptomyces sp. NPDC007117]|uniref:GNAT family N-acetyltransferase n=1 Tax=Streptomyces sp. NPDC007117 TaxID=3154314 RepID=UPI0033EA291E
MVTLRALALDDAPALARVYSGASIRHTTGRPLTLAQAHAKIRKALVRAAETPRAQWSWGILHESDLVGLISLRRRTPAMGTISYILREDTWGHGYATHAVHQVVTVAFSTAGLNRLEAMHHPDNPASGRVLAKAGFTRIGTSDRHTEDGTTVPYELYALETARGDPDHVHHSLTGATPPTGRS